MPPPLLLLLNLHPQTFTTFDYIPFQTVQFPNLFMATLIRFPLLIVAVPACFSLMKLPSEPVYNCLTVCPFTTISAA